MSRRDETRVNRDAAGVGPHVRGGTRLVPLGELDRIRIAEGEPDIRGWEISMLSGTVIGRVTDLLVDPDAGEVVMLDVDLAGTDRHSYAPIRAAQIDRGRRRVIIDSAELHDMNDVPSLARSEALSDDEARRFGEGYARLYGSRGFSRDEQRDWRVQRGQEDLHFRRSAADLGANASAAAARGDDTAVTERDSVRDRQALDRQALDRLHGEEAGETHVHGTHAHTHAHGDRPHAHASDATSASQPGAAADIRYAQRDEEIVVERRPVVIEEVVVRRRVVNADSPDATGAGDTLHADTHGADPRDRDRDGHVVDDRLRELRDDASRRDVR